MKFEISIEEAWDLFLRQERKCSLTGVEIYFGPSTYEKGTASVDRIDPSQGYTLQNIQWVHKNINDMKWDLSQKEFQRMCFLIHNPIKNGTSADCCPKTHHKNWRGCGNLSGDLFGRYQRNAKKRGIPFEIHLDQMWELFIEQNGVCAYTGLPLSLTGDISASLDRIDSTIGYISSNVQWIHKNINQKIKKKLTEEEFLRWCKKVVDYENNQN